MDAQLVGDILTHVGAFFLGAGVAVACIGYYMDRQVYRFSVRKVKHN